MHLRSMYKHYVWECVGGICSRQTQDKSFQAAQYFGRDNQTNVYSRRNSLSFSTRIGSNTYFYPDGNSGKKSLHFRLHKQLIQALCARSSPQIPKSAQEIFFLGVLLEEPPLIYYQYVTTNQIRSIALFLHHNAAVIFLHFRLKLSGVETNISHRSKILFVCKFGCCCAAVGAEM